MRKTILFTLIIALAAVLCSCNMDAQDGIYSAIASSTEESSTKVYAYLGYYNNCYYLLTDSAITRKGTGSDFTPISTTGIIAREAALLSDGRIFLHRNDGKLYEYAATGKETGTVNDITVTKLLTNGIAFVTKSLGSDGEEKGLYNCSTSAFKKLDYSVQSVLENESYTLVESTGNKIYIYDSNLEVLAAANEVNASVNEYVTIGFQAVSASEFYVLKSDGKVYKITDSNFEYFTSFSYTLPADRTYSFTYTKDGVSYLVFKTSENFVSINLSDKTITTVTTGYGSIRQNLVVNILPAAEEGMFIVATYSNYVWKINPSDLNDEPKNILN